MAWLFSSGHVYNATGNAGTATIAGITSTSNTDGSGGTNFGALSQIPGNVNMLAFITQPWFCYCWFSVWATARDKYTRSIWNFYYHWISSLTKCYHFFILRNRNIVRYNYFKYRNGRGKWNSNLY